MVHVSRDYAEQDTAVVIPADVRFLIVLYIIDVEHSGIWPNRPPSPPKLYTKGSICLNSLAHGAAIAVRGQFEALVIHLRAGI